MVVPKSLDIPEFTNATASHPRLIRYLNRAGNFLSTGTPLTADHVWEAARGSDLDDCEPTPEAREALDVLMESLAANVVLTPVGRYSAKDDTVRLARTHLRVHRALHETPEVSDTLLPPPIFIVGWPRTGTTFLHQLLAQDPANRTIPYWESFDPIPPKQGQSDKRIARLDEMLRLLSWIEPRYGAIHPMTATAPEECVALFMNEFRTLQFDFQYKVPDYARWLLEQDAGVAYQAHRRQLELIHFHRSTGERFVLKDPTHLVHLETLCKIYPNAKIIFTHRDPAIVLSSMCSLVAYTRSLFTDDVDPRELGTEIFEGIWPTALETARDFTQGMAEGRVVDVRHPDLLRDPMGTVEGIYSAFGLSLRDDAQSAMRRFIDERRKSHTGRHAHSLSVFGLDRDRVRNRFASYCRELDFSD